MVTLILFVLIFGVVVISHEFGHFLLAKANGIHVIEFSVGMGPNLFSFQKGDTKYSLKLLPIGGACMFEGEDIAPQDIPIIVFRYRTSATWDACVIPRMPRQ